MTIKEEKTRKERKKTAQNLGALAAVSVVVIDDVHAAVVDAVGRAAGLETEEDAAGRGRRRRRRLERHGSRFGKEAEAFFPLLLSESE